MKYLLPLLILLLSLALGAGLYYDYQLQQQHEAALQRQRDELSSRFDGLEKENQALEAKKESLSQSLDDLRKQSGELTSQVHSLQEQVASETEAMKAAPPAAAAPTANAAPVAPTLPPGAVVLNGPLPAAKPSDLNLGEEESGAGPAKTALPPFKSLTVYAIWDAISEASEDQIRDQMDELLKQFGPGNAYYHPGFAFIYGGLQQTELIARIAKEKHLSIGVIAGIQAHTGGRGSSSYFGQDLRSYQWRMKGNNWQGYYTGKNNAGHLEISEDQRDHNVPSPSRYSPLAQEQYMTRAHRVGKDFSQLVKDYPGVVTVINGVIEEELAVGASSIQGPEANDYLADYSPFAITEFRDWLRHTGMYDDDSGKYAGQGAPAAITGDFVEIKGKMRSPFYDDPDPNNSNGTGASFNQTFGTNFSTWDLKYWDTKLFPAPITDTTFKPMPGEGEKGYTEGGFDAPRQVDAESKWWQAWSWDFDDQDNTYPKGNPAHPAFGFRQCLVEHFVKDVFDAMASEGVPRDMMYAHQIPGEQVGVPRCRSSASPVWTGYLPDSGTVGVTCFGWFNPQRALQYSNLDPTNNNGWGIFEWHPRPNAKRDDQMLYDAAMKELIVYSRNNCRHLFAGWWNLKGKDADPDQTFWLNDSMFAKAIKAFLATTPEHPPSEPNDVNGDEGKIR